MRSSFITRSTRAEEQFAVARLPRREDKPQEKPPVPNRYKAFKVTEADSDASSKDSTETESEGELAMALANSMEEKDKKKKSPDCPICKTQHWLIKCKKFLEMTPQARRDVISRSKRCYICFKEHQVKECTYKRFCKKCDGKHHPLLHFSRRDDGANANIEEEEEEPPTSNEH
jgi:hypothetical protein